ncbi:DUF2382 domain-containing protein [Citricoccus sp. SGAir0253]|uniref:DUF2382 domain-containing protein n=1 Tax=Citricoccus sp. SGAir0253 TaxID=2567881 RepID=UPI0010CCED18|nr:PRC and DUF2382 domain-containing protein [Citricoccus sp. SGAir0253]QCU78827.1 DUF2382 domain-containing protein [Citricoccus sp. SGAir0253]
MQDFTTVENLQNATVYGNDGEKIGSVGQVYLDDQTDRPTFVTVRTGLFGMNETFIPVSEATQTADGLTVPFDKAFVKDAPNIDADGSLTPEEERRIYEYYRMDYGHTTGYDGTAADYTGPTGTDSGLRDTDRDAGLAASSGTAASGVSGLGVQRGADDRTAADLDRDVADRDTVGRDVDTDRETVVARNEELNVGTEVRESGRVRLRKHTYTDTETVEVPVTREDVVVERETIDPNSPEAQRSTGDEEVVVTTHEEVPVVDKTATAEKVTVDKTRVQDTERVSGTVQHEDIEVEGDGDTGTGRRV